MSKEKVVWKTLQPIPVSPPVIKMMRGAIRASTWRVFKPTIDLDTCTKCWTCVDYCPEGVIEKTDEGPKILYDLCKGCGVCANECPSEAITMEREER
jgi:2-oxoacid:acceptor oxidoreductase delta subunit (pyruvate/2-ketoisovalerate family)